MNSNAVPDFQRVNVLGQSSFVINGDDLLAPGRLTRPPRELLCLLLLSPFHTHSRAQAMELIWPHLQRDQAANACAKAIHALRREIAGATREGPHSLALETKAGQIRLIADPPIWTDAGAFQAALDKMHGIAAISESGLDEALTLYRGDLLPAEWAFDWLEPIRERLRSRWREAVLESAARSRVAGDHNRATGHLRLLLARDPADETAHREMMRVHHAAGQTDRIRTQLDECRVLLAEHLGAVLSAETLGLADDLLSGIPVRTMPRSRQFSPPAPPSPLIGRDQLLADVSDFLLGHHARLVTLTGPGGVGKTRLALELARQLMPEFSSGAALARLASTRQLDVVPVVILQELGLHDAANRSGNPLDWLKNELRDREMLLIIDNCEQLPGIGAIIADVLDNCAGVVVLATSRLPLHIRAEHLVTIEPLGIPHPARTPSLDAIAASESVQLLLARVRSADRGFQLTSANAAAVAQVCRQLDGLPLAIELAAPRLRTGSIDDLAKELGDRFLLLSDGFLDADPRHRSLWATIAWSYQLLSEDCQRLFRACSTFDGGFSEAMLVGLINAPEPDSLRRLLTTLIDHQLVVPLGERLSMLESIREFGSEMAARHGEMDALRIGHLSVMTGIAKEAGEALVGPRQNHWLERLRDERANIDLALRTSLSLQSGNSAARLAGALWRWWQVTSRFDEGLAWLERVIALDRGENSEHWCEVYSGAGALAHRAGEQTKAEAFHSMALERARAARDLRSEARASIALGALTRRQGDLNAANQLLEAGMAMAADVNDDRLVAEALNSLGHTANAAGDWHRERIMYEAALERFQAVGDDYGASIAQYNIGDVARRTGDFDRAITHMEAALATAREQESRDGVAAVMLTLASIWAERGEVDRARSTTLDAIETLRELGSVDYLAPALGMLAEIELRAGFLESARTATLEALELALDKRDTASIATALDTLGEIALREGNVALAAWLLDVTDTGRSLLGLAPDDPEGHERLRAEVKSRSAEHAVENDDMEAPGNIDLYAAARIVLNRQQDT